MPGPAGDAAQVVEQLLDAERAAVGELALEVVLNLLIGI